MSNPTNKTINIFINSPSAQKALVDLQARADRLTESIKKGQAAGKTMTKEIEQLGATKTQLNQLEQIMSGKIAPTLQMVQRRASELRNELERMSKDAPGYADKLNEFGKVSATLRTMRAELDSVGKVLDTAKSKFDKFWQTAFGVGAGSAIANGLRSLFSNISGIISDNAKLSDSLADIRKATGLTTEGVITLNDAIGKIDTRTSVEQLQEVAIGLGQIGQAATPEAVAAIDKIVVALGDEFGGGAKEITTNLGILRNNLQDLKTSDYGADMLHIGNALNVLGANGLATAPVIVDFANRMSGVASTFKLTSAQILGTAATMQELGIPAERGSTAFNKLMQKMASDTKTYASIAAYAGVSQKDFIKLLNTDMLAALGKVAEGVKAAGQNNVQLGAILKDLDADGAGAGEVLTKLGNNAGMLAEKIKLSSDALIDTSSITEEFNLKNTNLAAGLEKLKKVFGSYLTSGAVGNFLLGAVNMVTRLIGVLQSLGGFIQKNIVAFGIWTLAYVVQAGWVQKLITWIGLQIGITDKATASQVLSTLAAKAEIVATSALGVVKAALTLNITKLREQWRLMTTTMGVNPYAAILVAVGALAFAITNLIGNLSKLSGSMLANIEIAKRTLLGSIEQELQANRLVKAINAENTSSETRNRLIQDLIKLNPELLKGLNENNFATAEGKKIIDEYILSLREKAKAEALSQYSIELAKKEIETKSKLDEVNRRIAKAPFIPGIGAKFDWGIGGDKGQLQDLKDELKQIEEARKEVERQITESIKPETTAPDASVPQVPGYTSGLSDAEKSKIQRLEEQRAEFRRKMQAVADDAAAASESQDDLAIQKVKDKFNKLEEEAKKLFNAQTALVHQLSALSAAEGQELENLYKKQFEGRSNKEYEDSLEKLTAYYNKEKRLTNEQYAAGQLNKEAYTLKMLQLEEDEYTSRGQVAADYALTVKKAETDAEKFQAESAERKAARAKRESEMARNNTIAGFELKVALTRPGSDPELQAKRALLEARFRIETEMMDKTSSMYKLKQEELNKDLRKLDTEYLANKVELMGEFANTLSSVFGSFMTYLNQQGQQDVDSDRADTETKKANWKKLLDSKRIDQTKYDAEIEKLDKAQADRELQLRVQQFKREQAANLVQGGINLAMGISNIWAKYASNPIMAGILTALLTTTSLAQMAVVAAAKPPTYAKGRKPQGNGGVPEGRSHADGGIHLVDPVTGQILGEMEGNEPILSVDTYRNNQTIIDALLDSSMNRSGQRISIPWAFKTGGNLNYSRATDNMQYTRSIAAAGIAFNSISSNGSANQPGYGEMTQAIQRLVTLLDGGISANVYYNDIDKTNREVNQLKKASSLKPYA